MFTERDLNTLVRDEKAWHKAVAMADGDELRNEMIARHLPTVPCGLLRRGSCDNAATLRFLSNLRSRDSLATMPSSAHYPPVQRTWSHSTRVDGERDRTKHDDILVALLRRSAAAKQVTTPIDGKGKGRPHRVLDREEVSPAQRHQRGPRGDTLDSVQLLARRLASLEETERAQLVRHEGSCRASATHLFRQHCLCVVADDEYRGRRALFREAMGEKAVILQGEMDHFAALTGLSHGVYARLTRVQREEETRRIAIAREHEHVAGILQQLARLEEVQLIEREIALCARRERQLALKMGAKATS